MPKKAVRSRAVVFVGCVYTRICMKWTYLYPYYDVASPFLPLPWTYFLAITLTSPTNPPLLQHDSLAPSSSLAPILIPQLVQPWCLHTPTQGPMLMFLTFSPTVKRNIHIWPCGLNCGGNYTKLFAEGSSLPFQRVGKASLTFIARYIKMTNSQREFLSKKKNQDD